MPDLVEVVQTTLTLLWLWQRKCLCIREYLVFISRSQQNEELI